MEPTSDLNQGRRRATNHQLSTGLWVAARYTALGVAVVVVVGLFIKPQLSLVALLDIIVPIVPAALLLNPLIWRNVCPLATANMISNRIGPRRRPDQNSVRKMMVLGIVLFFVLVPARRFLFNENAIVLSSTIIALILVSLALGAYYDMKSGFCNSFCPVLPVERFYGFSPLVKVSNQRCVPRCTGCAPACIDLGPEKAPRQALGNARKGNFWTFTPFGVFALAFPGFILGYNSVTNGPLADAVNIYAVILGYSAAAAVLFGTLAIVFKLPFGRMLPVLTAVAAVAYYWFAAPTMIGAFGLDQLAGVTFRWAIFAFIGVWLVIAVRRSSNMVPQPRTA